MSNQYCQWCGFEISHRNKFCTSCGRKLPVSALNSTEHTVDHRIEEKDSLSFLKVMNKIGIAVLVYLILDSVLLAISVGNYSIFAETVIRNLFFVYLFIVTNQRLSPDDRQSWQENMVILVILVFTAIIKSSEGLIYFGYIFPKYVLLMVYSVVHTVILLFKNRLFI